MCFLNTLLQLRAMVELISLKGIARQSVIALRDIPHEWLKNTKV